MNSGRLRCPLVALSRRTTADVQCLPASGEADIIISPRQVRFGTRKQKLAGIRSLSEWARASKTQAYNPTASGGQATCHPRLRRLGHRLRRGVGPSREPAGNLGAGPLAGFLLFRLGLTPDAHVAIPDEAALARLLALRLLHLDAFSAAWDQTTPNRRILCRRHSGSAAHRRRSSSRTSRPPAPCGPGTRMYRGPRPSPSVAGTRGCRQHSRPAAAGRPLVGPGCRSMCSSLIR